jgi:hypothetical protein
MDTPERFTEASIRAFLQKNNELPYPATTRRPRIAFLPAGEHEVRFFWDPTAMLMREIGIHSKRKLRTHCLKYLKLFGPPADYPECAICTLYEQTGLWYLRPEIVTLYN